MMLRLALAIAALTSLILVSTPAEAKKKTPEEECIDYKPDRTLSSETTSEMEGSVGAKGWGVTGDASMAGANAERRNQQELPEEELLRKSKLYDACLLYKRGDLSEDGWQQLLSTSLGLSPTPTPTPRPSALSVLAGQLRNQAVQTNAKPKKPKVPGVQLTRVLKPCGRYEAFDIHVPKRYNQKACMDEAGKSRFIFTSSQAKGATCQAMSQWATGNGFSSVSKSNSPAKDEMVFSKAGLPGLTIKCVNFPRDSGKPTRLVFILAPQ